MNRGHQWHVPAPWRPSVGYPFVFFAAMMALAVVVVLLFFPETKGSLWGDAEKIGALRKGDSRGPFACKPSLGGDAPGTAPGGQVTSQQRFIRKTNW